MFMYVFPITINYPLEFCVIYQIPAGDGEASLHEPHVIADSARLLRLVEVLINEIEKMGLFTVGIYRKPGPAAKIKKLLYSISTTPGTSLF